MAHDTMLSRHGRRTSCTTERASRGLLGPCMLGPLGGSGIPCMCWGELHKMAQAAPHYVVCKATFVLCCGTYCAASGDRSHPFYGGNLASEPTSRM